MMDKRLEKNLRLNWHPYTQMSMLSETPPLLIERAEGIKLYDEEGRSYYDTIASWWCNVHGHGHPHIREAVHRQMQQLDHVLFAGITHKGAIELSERLVQLTPEGLSRVFYSDDGSTAVEVALKMSLQYWRNVGHPEKNTFVCLDRGYHGDTVGCMSVGGMKEFTGPFEPLLFDVHRAECPYCYRCPLGKSNQHCDTDCIKSLEQILIQHADRAAAIIMEPLLIAAGGMIVYPANYLKRASELARRHKVHLIVDEVATGFGRTGSMFACEHVDVRPDFLCLSKGLTSGTLPFAATLTTEAVYESFIGPPDSGKTFYHGHTYTANPIGCAAALASLDLFTQDKLLDHIAEMAPRLREGMEQFSTLPHVGDVRGIGMVAALELVEDKDTRKPFRDGHPIMRKIYQEGLQMGLILRPLGNVAYLMLPLCTTADELEDILGKLEITLQNTLTL